MPELKRPVLLSKADDQLQILPADAACASCPAPCRPVATAPKDATPADLSLSSGLLNRLAMAFFGVPLLFIGCVIYVLDALSSQSFTPVALLGGVALACALGGKLAQRYLHPVARALKSSEIV